MKTNIKVLFLINEKPSISISELCSLTSLSKSNIVFHLKQLEKEGLIQKIEGKKNRSFNIHPTKKGKDIYLKIKINQLLDCIT